MGDRDTLTAPFGIGAGICPAARGEIGSAIPPGFAQTRANTGAKGNAEQRDAGSKFDEGIRCRGGAGRTEKLQDSAGTSVAGGRRGGFKMDAHMGRKYYCGNMAAVRFIPLRSRKHHCAAGE